MRIGEELHVHAMAAMLARVVQAVTCGRQPVGRCERAVQHDIRLAQRGPQRLPQVRGQLGEQVDHLGHVAVRGRGADTELGRQAREGLVAAQVHQHQQRLTARRQPPPPRPELCSMPADQIGHELAGRGGQIQRSTIEQHRSSWWSRWSQTSTYQELFRLPTRRAARDQPVTSRDQDGISSRVNGEHAGLVLTQALAATRLALLVTERHLLIPASYIFEIPWYRIFLGCLEPLVRVGAVRYVSPVPDLADYREMKVQEYRRDVVNPYRHAAL